MENTERLKRLNSFNQYPNNVALPYISAKSWAIYDMQVARIIQGKKENQQREVASLTKIMTFYTVLRLLDHFNLDPNKTVVTVSKIAS